MSGRRVGALVGCLVVGCLVVGRLVGLSDGLAVGLFVPEVGFSVTAVRQYGLSDPI